MDDGEFWRLFTAPLLHASPAHLVGNLVALLVAGSMLEPMVGIGWFGAVYFVGGFCGTVTSILINPAGLQSVGASGAIMSCLACLFALSFHDGAPRPKRMRRISASLLFPALAPAVSHGAVVDIYAHAGGTMAGVALAFTLLVLWPDDKPQIPGRSAAALVAAAFMSLTVIAFAVSATSYRAYADQAANFIPEAQLRSSASATDETSNTLIAKYPDDPRGHMLRAIYFLRQGRLGDSESQFQVATDLAATHPGLLPETTARAMRAALALAMGQRSRDEGRRLAAPLCADAELEPKWQQLLNAAHLCDAK